MDRCSHPGGNPQGGAGSWAAESRTRSTGATAGPGARDDRQGRGGRPGAIERRGPEVPSWRCHRGRGDSRHLDRDPREDRRGRGERAAWWSWRESNPRPPECHSGTLPTELQPHAAAEATAAGRVCQSGLTAPGCCPAFPPAGVCYASPPRAGVAKLVYAGDSKSPGLTAVRVRLPPPAPAPSVPARGRGSRETRNPGPRAAIEGGRLPMGRAPPSAGR